MHIGSSNGVLMPILPFCAMYDDEYNHESVDVLSNVLFNTSILPEPGAYGEELMAAEEACHIEPPLYQHAMDPREAYYPQQKFFHDLITAPAPVPEWTHKNIYHWTPQDTKDFIMQTAQSKNLKLSRIPYFQFAHVTGLDLISMSDVDFIEKFNIDGNHSVSSFVGSVIYDELQKIKCDCSMTDKSLYKLEDQNYGYSSDGDKKITNLDIPYYEADCRRSSSSDSDSSSLGDYKPPCVGPFSQDPSAERAPSSCAVVKRAPGRPKGSGKKQNKKLKNVSVPEFLRDLLLNNEHCPTIIKWENYDTGMFRFVNATEVARLWGVLKRNQKMNFEKFSRAMRYHYKQKVLVSSVPRLVYQFGTAPNTPTYYTSNPNFDRSS